MRASKIRPWSAALAAVLAVAVLAAPAAASKKHHHHHKHHHHPSPPPPPPGGGGGGGTITVDPFAAPTTGKGETAFAINGSGWLPFEAVHLDLSPLSALCSGVSIVNGGSAHGATLNVSSDDEGRFVAGMTGTGCKTGTATISGTGFGNPRHKSTADVSLIGFGGGGARVELVPSTATDTGTVEMVSTIEIHGLQANGSVKVDSFDLRTACSSFARVFNGKSGLNLPATETVDASGNLALLLSGSGCKPDTYQITVTEKGGAQRNFQANLVVNA
jgi:hypothetical protein